MVHSLGHNKANVGDPATKPHFNVRPHNNPNTGYVDGTKATNGDAEVTLERDILGRVTKEWQIQFYTLCLWRVFFRRHEGKCLKSDMPFFKYSDSREIRKRANTKKTFSTKLQKNQGGLPLSFLSLERVVNLSVQRF